MPNELRVDDIKIFLTRKNWRRLLRNRQDTAGLRDGYYYMELEKCWMIFNIEDNLQHFLPKSNWDGELHQHFDYVRNAIDYYLSRTYVHHHFRKCIQITKKEYDKIRMTLELSK